MPMEKRLSTKTKIYLTIGLIIVGALLLWGSNYWLESYGQRILKLIAVYGVLAVSYTFVNGITGMFSLGHAGFVAVGAYVSALLTMSPMEKEMSFILEPLIWPLN
ncbi:MAG: branched-chain amino acid transport system permease protein, partial [Thermotogota bacterium]|nr:branched-chain amino acid transport system permease protein [Thermotogota bacterium]